MIVGETEVAAISPSVQMATLSSKQGKVIGQRSGSKSQAKQQGSDRNRFKARPFCRHIADWNRHQNNQKTVHSNDCSILPWTQAVRLHIQGQANISLCVYIPINSVRNEKINRIGARLSWDMRSVRVAWEA